MNRFGFFVFLVCTWTGCFGVSGLAAQDKDPCQLLALEEVNRIMPDITRGRLDTACCIPNVRSCNWFDKRDHIKMLVIIVQSPEESIQTWLRRVGLLYDGVRFVPIPGIGDQAGATIDRRPGGYGKREEITSIGAKRGNSHVEIMLISLRGNEHSPLFHRLKKILQKALDRLAQ